ncbi:MAG: DUF2752 domain-containing protein [Bacillota bacterium]|nr:DUF2752 domain-containing protein [Bacillota bacterium]MDW7730529.1 DUF2752 domain-containing protein [Bacillota bacterium]
MPSNNKRPASPWLERGLLLLTLLILVMIYLYVITPALRELVRPDHCLFYRLTGMLCPACGGTRAVIHLFSGNILLAIKSNALIIFSIPLVIYMLFIMTRLVFDNSFTLDHIKFSPVWPWSAFAIIMFFWVLRNFEGFSFLRPLN